ncbi:VOC family protein [Amycolatopsis thermophila]|uniref:Catechol 2,3-dioxygenase-like lactoylglutathione lyase family enzyme n=1 Tax=Amycolatopsis thermophila TaxID=206084 RepID=A0ABU0ESR4_9PSEU|nr:VOC family protein [Amycolatopsis thermophila]MDQ0378346.1 catechol 2,3-dioxygenase-like lactoylglutathione lyase family enzyme [Amycolatopsis thermophila]
MRSRILAVAVDCHDTEKQARFWSAALGYEVVKRWRDAKGLEYVDIGTDGQWMIVFQPVGEDKVVKNRLHLDLVPEEGGQANEVARLTGLGARVLSDDPDLPWVVLADPEDNEFCVLPPRSPD